LINLKLADLANRYRVIVDTSSLMYFRAEWFFMETMLPAFKHFQAKLYIYSSVVREVDNHCHSKKLYKRRAAQNAVRIVKDLTTYRLSELVEDGGIFADFVIYNEVARLRKDYNVALITQDRWLSQDVLAIKNIRSSRYNTDIQVFRINDSSELVSWEDTLLSPGGTKLMNDKDKYLQIPPKNKIAVPTSSNNEIQIPKPLQPQKTLQIINRADKEVLVEKQKDDTAVFLQPTLVTIPGLVKQKSATEQRPENINFLERVLRSVSGTFRHPRRRRGFNIQKFG
jgi:rRNA-processing protein FCF1